MNQRTFLNGMLAGFALTQLPACRFSFEEGISNPGLRPLPNQVDHPLPGIMSLFPPNHFVTRGLFDAGQVLILREIGKHNALLFDFVLKRSLRAGAHGLPAGVFETRRFFLD
jgi:hypothetical protein